MIRRTMAVGILLALALTLYAGPSPEAQTTATCDAVCQALINTPGYNFAPAAAAVCYLRAAIAGRGASERNKPL